LESTKTCPKQFDNLIKFQCFFRYVIFCATHGECKHASKKKKETLKLHTV
jgi:hypothetical protein